MFSMLTWFVQVAGADPVQIPAPDAVGQALPPVLAGMTRLRADAPSATEVVVGYRAEGPADAPGPASILVFVEAAAPGQEPEDALALLPGQQHSGRFDIGRAQAGWAAHPSPLGEGFVSSATVVVAGTAVTVRVDPAPNPQAAVPLLHALPISQVVEAFTRWRAPTPVSTGPFRIGDPIVLGAVNVADVHAGIAAAPLSTCVVGAPEGKVVIKFSIAKDGTVASSIVKSTTLGSLDIEKCLAERIAGLRFPEPAGGGIAIVSYPFVFGP
jgi:hypothetical protein